MERLTIHAKLSELPGIGPRFAARFEKLGVKTVRDILKHFPFRYEDWSAIATIGGLVEGESKTIRAAVQEIKSHRVWNRKLTIIEATLIDATGTIKAVWFNQPYIAKMLKPGTVAQFAGKVSRRKSEIYINNPTYEMVGKRSRGETKHTGRLVPIYPETKGLTSKGIRYCIAAILERLEDIPESLPDWLRETYDLPEINEAVKRVHFPETETEAGYARERFVFEELLLMQLKSMLERRARTAQKAYAIKNADAVIARALKHIPFELTHAQKEALRETVDDMARMAPMNRLIQGDVGAGKTIIAALAALVVAENGKQVAVMAPTEILARQHYKTLQKLFPDCAQGIGLLTAKESRAFYGKDLETKIDKKNCLQAAKKGTLKIVIGTHALLQKNLAFKNLALVVVDEQHRFGVAQRAELLKRYQVASEKKQVAPHFLSMSATPIPRTLMIALYGDLDVSLVNELPKGRKTIITKIVDDAHRGNAYAFIRGQIQKGRQAFVICPRIDPVEIVENNEIMFTRDEQMAREVKTVSEEFERLQKIIFPDLRVAMLHGKMKSKEKDEIMQKFANRESDILVATSVVEVGVDVPNATMIIIEGSDRFGLAQLYQLRGRVGRGDRQSFCLLFTASQTEKTAGRLSALCTAKTGFELAEKDLELRGPGEFLGSEQTGIPDTAMRALKKPELFKRARNAAEELLAQDETLATAPLLKQKLIAFEKEIHNE